MAKLSIYRMGLAVGCNQILRMVLVLVGHNRILHMVMELVLVGHSQILRMVMGTGLGLGMAS